MKDSQVSKEHSKWGFDCFSGGCFLIYDHWLMTEGEFKSSQFERGTDKKEMVLHT